MSKSTDELLTARQVANLCGGVSANSVMLWRRSGRLAALRVGDPGTSGRWLYRRHDVEEFRRWRERILDAARAGSPAALHDEDVLAYRGARGWLGREGLLS